MTSMYNDVSEVRQIHKWATMVLSKRYYNDIKGGIKMTSMYDNDVSEVRQIHKWATTVLSMRMTSKEVSK